MMRERPRRLLCHERHRLYGAEERHLVEVRAESAEPIRDWLGKRLGWRFAIPDLSDLGFGFSGARLLAINGAPVAQLIYVSLDGGKPVGLCFLRSEKNDVPFRMLEYDDLNPITWRRTGYDRVAVGWADVIGLEQIARKADRAFSGQQTSAAQNNDPLDLLPPLLLNN